MPLWSARYIRFNPLCVQLDMVNIVDYGNGVYYFCFNPLCVQLDMVTSKHGRREYAEKFQSAVRAIRYGADKVSVIATYGQVSIRCACN